MSETRSGCHVEIKKHCSPSELINSTKNCGIKHVFTEIYESSKSISSHTFDFSSPICLAVGQEKCGVPIEMIVNCAGVTQLVESQPSKLLVAGSNPVSRSTI